MKEGGGEEGGVIERESDRLTIEIECKKECERESGRKKRIKERGRTGGGTVWWKRARS